MMGDCKAKDPRDHAEGALPAPIFGGDQEAGEAE